LECLAFAEIQLTATQIVKLQAVLNDCVNHPNDEVQAASEAAFREFSRVYHNSVGRALIDRTIAVFIKPLDEFNERQTVPANLTRGGALALGALNINVLKFELPRIVSAIRETCKLKNNKDLEDAETRKHAAQALGGVMTTMLMNEQRENPGGSRFKEELTDAEVPDISGYDWYGELFAALVECMEDYHTDRRGDVGSWVRGVAMTQLVRIFDYREPTPEEWITVANILLQQLCEKIDKLRQLAGSLMTAFISMHSPPESVRNHLLPIFMENDGYIKTY
jgi:hypothetical protein